MLEAQNCLDQACDAGGCIQVSDVCLKRSDGAEPFLGGTRPKSLRQCSNLNGITQVRSGPVRLYIANGLGVDPSQRLGQRNHFCLTVDTGCGVADLQRAVVVDG